VSPSRRTNTSCPPSRAGNGSELRIARFTDTIPANDTSVVGDPLASVRSDPAFINDIGPPTSTEENLYFIFIWNGVRKLTT